MYKLLLCWRYLLTRYLALACIVSVMLGVATLIVVNSVMSGFSTKLKEKLHSLLSDVVVESFSLDGFADPRGKVRRILESPVGDKIAALTPTVESFAMLQFRLGGETITKPVRLIGIEPEGRAAIGGFAEHVVDQARQRLPATFELSREALHRQFRLNPPLMLSTARPPAEPGQPPPPDPPPSTIKVPAGIIVGWAIASYRDRSVKAGEPPREVFLLQPGDDVVLTTVSGQKLAPVCDRFALCAYFKSEMSEYDANYVFVPLDYLQKIRTLEDRATHLLIKLKDYADAHAVRDHLRESGLFPETAYSVQTWEDRQGPLLAAISIERGLLNVLLFLIIAVAGFGILAIFSMIVVEKTRDIGVLKALGASNGGVMAIFLGYGLLLGVVGAGLGTGLGLAITTHINEIEVALTKLTGQEIFDRGVYYFDQIPTNIQPFSVLLVNLGAVVIATGASIIPALRAALLHPVRALRYE